MLLQFGDELGKCVFGIGEQPFFSKRFLGEIKNLAAQVEGSFIIPMSSILDEDMARKEAIIEVLLLNFPIMRATRVENQEKMFLLTSSSRFYTLNVFHAF